MRLTGGLMLPAEAYTSPEVLARELRLLYAGSWTCLGRRDQLVTEQAVRVGDVGALLVLDGDTVRMFANNCRHRGHAAVARLVGLISDSYRAGGIVRTD
ncbi:MAG: hypothetical protein ABIQ59_03155 [Nocardioidaceae bacterium]